jgi:hypothetical protein
MAGGTKKKKIRSGGRRLLRVKMDFRVRFPLFFLYFSFKISPLVLSCGPIFIGKVLLGPQNWSLNFPFFCKF